MDIPTLETIALSLPGVEKEIKWKSDLVFMVGSKMFFVIDLEGPPHSASFKVQEERFEELAATTYFRPAPYFARAGWVAISAGSPLSGDEVEAYVREAHRIVAGKLTRKVRTQLGLQ